MCSSVDRLTFVENRLFIKGREICSSSVSCKADYKLYYKVGLGHNFESTERSFDSVDRYFFFFTAIVGVPLFFLPLAFLDPAGIDLPHNRTQHF
jgi:hypothetical protein